MLVRSLSKYGKFHQTSCSLFVETVPHESFRSICNQIFSVIYISADYVVQEIDRMLFLVCKCLCCRPGAWGVVKVSIIQKVSSYHWPQIAFKNVFILVCMILLSTFNKASTQRQLMRSHTIALYTFLLLDVNGSGLKSFFHHVNR